MATDSGTASRRVNAGYHELSLGEALTLQRAQEGTRGVRLAAYDAQSVTVEVEGAAARIPLGHFADRTLGNPPGDVVSVVEVAGLKTGAVATRLHMQDTRYSRTHLGLKRDARLYLGEAGEPLTPAGTHVFPLPDYAWNYGENWLQHTPYGWHLGVDLDAARGHPLLAVVDSTVIAIRRRDPGAEEDYWGNNLGLLGDDGIVYCYMHWEALTEGITEGSRLEAGERLGAMGRSGFETKPIATHLHFEMMLLAHPERFSFAYALEPDVLPTPNRYLPPEVEGYVINPYPYLVEWYRHEARTGTPLAASGDA